MAKIKRILKKRVSKRRYSRRKTTRKHSNKIYRNKNKRKTRCANRTKKRMMGGSSKQEMSIPTHIITQDETPLRNSEIDKNGNGPFAVIRENDELLSKYTPVYVFDADHNIHSIDNFTYRKVKLENGHEGYIRRDYLTSIPSQTPAPAPQLQSVPFGKPAIDA